MSLSSQKRLRADCDIGGRPQNEIKRSRSSTILPKKADPISHLVSGYRRPDQFALVGSTACDSIVYDDHTSSIISPDPSTPRSQVSDSSAIEVANAFNDLANHQGLQRTMSGLEEADMHFQTNGGAAEGPLDPSFDLVEWSSNHSLAKSCSAISPEESGTRTTYPYRDGCRSSIQGRSHLSLRTGEAQLQPSQRTNDAMVHDEMAISPKSVAVASSTESWKGATNASRTFVMGPLSNCPRCIAREPGHYAHFR